MKKRILLFTTILGMGYLILSGYASGPAFNGQNRTGARGSITTCNGTGCHGTGSSTIVGITVDSGTVATTHYVPGHVYTIKIHGTNSSSLPKFGFEFASVSGTGASQVQAGAASGFTGTVTTHTLAPLTFVEHNIPIAAATAGVYDESFTWTAPPAAVGTITMYCTLNAVNGNNSADPNDISGNTSYTLTPISGTTSITEVANNMGVTAYPNPVMNTLNLQAAHAGTYSVMAYNLNGCNVLTAQMSINGTAGINTSNWPAGFYNIVVTQDNKIQVIPVVKQ